MKKALHKHCQACGQVFFKKVNESKKYWKEKKFCCKKCGDKNRDFTNTIARMKNNNPARLSHNIERMKNNNPMSHGGEVAYKRNDYKAIHEWVKRNFGTSDKRCEECGKIDTRPRMIHWANISGEYKKERSDWKRLCYKCHKKLDYIKNKNR